MRSFWRLYHLKHMCQRVIDGILQKWKTWHNIAFARWILESVEWNVCHADSSNRTFCVWQPLSLQCIFEILCCRVIRQTDDLAFFIKRYEPCTYGDHVIEVLNFFSSSTLVPGFTEGACWSSIAVRGFFAWVIHISTFCARSLSPGLWLPSDGLPHRMLEIVLCALWNKQILLLSSNLFKGVQNSSFSYFSTERAQVKLCEQKHNCSLRKFSSCRTS